MTESLMRPKSNVFGELVERAGECSCCHGFYLCRSCGWTMKVGGGRRTRSMSESRMDNGELEVGGETVDRRHRDRPERRSEA